MLGDMDNEIEEAARVKEVPKRMGREASTGVLWVGRKI